LLVDTVLNLKDYTIPDNTQFYEVGNPTITKTTGFPITGTLYPGRGYWVKVTSEFTITITGAELSATQLNIPVGFKSFSLQRNESVDLSSIGNVPDNIQFYEVGKPTITKTAGFPITGTLYPGRGYWVKSLVTFIYNF
jgi:predicted RNA-binding protein YlxR (DUF448 family)